jgi:hypothetical protein
MLSNMHCIPLVTAQEIFGPESDQLNSVVLVRKRTIPTERPQPVGEVSANFS